MLDRAVDKIKVKPKVTVSPTPVSVKLNPVIEVLTKIVEAIKNGNDITDKQKEELKQLTEQVKGDFEATTQAIKDIPELPDIKSLVTKITDHAGVIETTAKTVNQTTKSANKNTEQLVTEAAGHQRPGVAYELWIGQDRVAGDGDDPVLVDMPQGAEAGAGGPGVVPISAPNPPKLGHRPPARIRSPPP